VILDRLGGQAQVGRLVREHLGHDDLVVGEPGVAELLGRREAGVREARVPDVDPGVDDADLHALSGVGGAADRGGRPGLLRLDQARSGSLASLGA